MSAEWILHVDLDQFQAAVEVLRQPGLAGQPVVVGGNGDPTEPRKVVTCASYEARAFGVHAGMPLRAAARRCPDAVFLPLDGPAYEAASTQVMDTLRSFPVEVEVWGWDEAFVGAVTDEPETLARDVQLAVGEAAGLRCSVGIGDSKQRAKIATGFAKPAGIARLDKHTWMPTMGSRPTIALWGIGKRTATKLAAHGLHTVADLAAAEPGALAEWFGPTIGPWLRHLALGTGSTRVSTEPRVARSRSHVITFPSDLTSREEIEQQLDRIARALTAEVVADGRTVRRVAIVVRTATFFTRTRIKTLPGPSQDVDEIAPAAVALLERFELTRPVRLLGVRVEFPD
ncbi:MAG TPA: DNA polymerase IV [Jatrophihabitantaceae bacterium]